MGVVEKRSTSRDSNYPIQGQLNLIIWIWLINLYLQFPVIFVLKYTESIIKGSVENSLFLRACMSKIFQIRKIAENWNFILRLDLNRRSDYNLTIKIPQNERTTLWKAFSTFLRFTLKRIQWFSLIFVTSSIHGRLQVSVKHFPSKFNEWQFWVRGGAGFPSKFNLS